MKKNITYQSSDNITKINALMWIPETEVKAIIQISHGMLEFVERYEGFALEMNHLGILVCGNDHLGHGYSLIDEEHRGYFAKKNADAILVDDVYNLTKLVKEEYPNIPYFILGHSMGSFILRNYIYKYGEHINGAIIMGTGYQNNITLTFAQIITAITQFYHHGWFYKSPYLDKITTGNYHKYFPEKNKFSWLTKNTEILRSFQKDPRSRFRFSCNAYYTLFTLIKNCNKKKNLEQIPKNLPLYLLSGSQDPVGHFGKDIIKLNNIYKKHGLTNIKYRLYNHMRHEILQESDKVLVHNDIIQFITNNSK